MRDRDALAPHPPLRPLSVRAPTVTVPVGDEGGGGGGGGGGIALHGGREGDMWSCRTHRERGIERDRATHVVVPQSQREGELSGVRE